MKLQEYANLIGCTYRTAQNHFKQGRIPKAFKVGSVIHVPDNVLELLQESYNEIDSSPREDDRNEVHH